MLSCAVIVVADDGLACCQVSVI